MFDTVITRDVARPKDLFVRLGEACKEHRIFADWRPVDWDQFFDYRTDAERQARQKTLCEDVTLWEVYQQLAVMLGLEGEKTRSLMALEIELEQQSARPVPSILAEIAAARSSGRNVIFISDMYLPADVLKSMLEACGAFQPGDKLYVSSEVGLTKASGNLFRHCLAQEKIPPGQLHHWGDNEHADIRRAQELGIKTTYFTGAHLNRYEQTIADAHELNLPNRSLVAGASRLARIYCPQADKHRQTIWNTGANVAGPVLTGYVTWLLMDARSRGIQRLYFVSRDGQILLRIAQIICRKLDLPLECRYLYGSRQAWHLPALTALGDFEYGWILASTNFLSIRSLLMRVDITPAEIESELSTYDLAAVDWDQNLDLQARQRLEALVRSGRLNDLILERAAERRDSVLSYFVQEGLCDAVPYALVDIGWHGRLQRSVGDILALGGYSRALRGYYFGLRSRIQVRPEDELHVYFWDHQRPSAASTLGFQTRIIMEAFTVADHGGVQEYTVENGVTLPVLRSKTNEFALDWGLQVQQEAILRFVEELDAAATHSMSDPAWVDVLVRVLQQFYHTPTLSEAKAYGKFPDAEDQNEAFHHPLARDFGVSDIFRCLSTGDASHHHNEWYYAARRLTSWPALIGLRLAQHLWALVPHKK